MVCGEVVWIDFDLKEGLTGNASGSIGNFCVYILVTHTHTYLRFYSVDLCWVEITFQLLN